MFTGIVSHVGIFREFGFGRGEFTLEAPEKVAEGLETGDSLAVDGVCLSLVGQKKNNLTFNLSKETVEKTTLGQRRRGDLMNLELPLTLSSPLSGHLVTGHIDGKGKILGLVNRKEGKRISVGYPRPLRPYFVLKGSVAVNGVSLTVAQVASERFEVEIIPITLKQSNLGRLKRGDEVNLECDILGKYVYNLMSEIKDWQADS